MITRPDVFDDEHLPRHLLHREGAVETLTRAWAPVRHGDRADDVLLHGPSGVGKTALARHTLQRLDVHTAHVRCLGQTTGDILRGVLADLPGADPVGNEPLEDLDLQLRERVDDPVVVVLDEADGLPATDALPRLLDVPLLSVVVICHNPDDWLARVDDRVRRRLAGHELGLDRYGVDELADILEARARLGLPPSSVSREHLEAIADEVAGVAREGIQSLRAAAELAGERGHSQIREPDVDDAYERARRWIRESNLQSLPIHHHVIYELIRQWGPLGGGALHERYDEIAAAALADVDRTPLSERARRNKLDKLIAYDLVAAEGQGPHREYRVVDERLRSTVVDIGTVVT